MPVEQAVPLGRKPGCSAARPERPARSRGAAYVLSNSTIGFGLFLLVNAALFIRPAEIVPGLLGLPIYEVLILACLAASLPAVIDQLALPSLARQPITVCVLGLLVAVLCSHLSGFSVWEARMTAFEFAQVVLYYLLFVGVVNTATRLRGFLTCLVGLIAVLTALALLHYHEVINIAALEAVEEADFDETTGEQFMLRRLCSTGIYNDPNDLSLILVVGVVICCDWLTNRRSRFFWRWLSPPLIGLFGYALSLTHSRGGFLALLAGMLVLFSARFSWRKTCLLGAATLPAMFVLFSGRQTNINLGGDDTMQARIQLWSEGLDLFREAPLFGIGCRQYADEVGQVAHNSFVHCFVELGFLGGTLFVGAFFCALLALYRMGRPGAPIADPVLARLRPYVIAIIAAYGAGLLSLSRAYVAPTYMVLGLASACVRLTSASWPTPVVRCDARLAVNLVLVSVASLVGIYLFIRVFVQYG
jgi:O-antigen ligase